MVRSFLLSDQAYRKAYRAKVIVFDVGSVHRFSTRYSEVMPWSRFAPLQRPLVFKHALPALGHRTVSRGICFFKRHIDVDLRFQEQGHLDQFSADGRRLNVRPLDRTGRVRRQGQRLVWRQREGNRADLGPDGSMNPLRIADCRREEVDNQEVVAPEQCLDGLVDERAEGELRGLVARRHELEQGDDPVSADMANDEGPAFEDVFAHLDLVNESGPGRNRGHGQGAGGRLLDTKLHRKLGSLQGEHIRSQRSRDLLGLDIVAWREPASVESVADLGHPCEMKVVPGSGSNPSPIVNGHGGTSYPDCTR